MSAGGQGSGGQGVTVTRLEGQKVPRSRGPEVRVR